MPDELQRLALNGRATESQFAQNPLPIARAMGLALAALHQSEVPHGLSPCTPDEIDNVYRTVASAEKFPHPFTRVSREAIEALLGQVPESPNGNVLTHGAPVVGAAILVDSVVTFESAGTEGFDPPERDLAIVMRSIAETFTSEVARTFLDGYEEAGGALPHAPTLDWYGLLAAFR